MTLTNSGSQSKSLSPEKEKSRQPKRREMNIFLEPLIKNNKFNKAVYEKFMLRKI